MSATNCEICGMEWKYHGTACSSGGDAHSFPPHGSPSGIELEVCNDIATRQAKGLAKYGVTVANNPLELKAWLQHAYEEALDNAIYLKRAMREMENADI